MKYYYADSQNKTSGPVTLEELRELIRMGTLKNDPLVVPEGGSEWKPLSTFKFEAAEPESSFSASTPGRPTGQSGTGGGFVPFNRTFSGTILADLVAVPVKYSHGWLSEGFLNRSLAFARNTGHYVILAGGALGLIYCIVSAIRGNQLIPALIGIGFIVALAIAQFVAVQFLNAGDALIAHTPHRISSRAFLECCGLFALLGALGVLLTGFLMGIQLGGMSAVMIIIIFAIYSVVLVYLAAAAFNPQVVNISIGTASAGDEAVGILGFFLKAGLKLLPIIFFFGGIAADLIIIGSFSSRTQSADMGDSLGGLPFLGVLSGILATSGGYGGIAMLLLACSVPFIGYALFLLFNLGLEIISAILSLTAKR